MNQVAYFPGKYIQGSGAIRQLDQLIRNYGQQAIILGSPTVMQHLPEAYLQAELNEFQIIPGQHDFAIKVERNLRGR